MLQLFRNHSVFAAIGVILIGIAIRLPVLLTLPSYSFMDTAPFSSKLFSLYNSLENVLLWSYVTACVLVLLQAFLLNYIVSRHEVLYKFTYLPALVFVVLTALYPEQSQLSPQLLANTFILLMLHRLCYLYDAPNPVLPVLDAGMFLGIGLLFNYDLLIFLPFILISVVVFTSFNMRYILVAILGILLPFYMTWVYFYMTDKVSVMYNMIEKSMAGWHWRPGFSNFIQLFPWILILFIAISGTVQLQQNYFKNKVKTRRVLQSIGVLFVMACISIFLENTNIVFALFYLNIPLAVVIGYFFISGKRKWYREFLFLGLVALSLYFNLRIG